MAGSPPGEIRGGSLFSACWLCGVSTTGYSQGMTKTGAVTEAGQTVEINDTGARATVVRIGPRDRGYLAVALNGRECVFHETEVAAV